MSLAPKKIAVLGGGVSSMASVYQLTSEENWQSKYDITVYQLGWRLGGKCASGRNPDIADRIEEHGLHLWFGFYDNAFEMIQNVYAENNRPLTQPLATWQEALKPYNFTVLAEKGKEWFAWPFTLPSNEKVPGVYDHNFPQHPSIAEMALQMMKTVHQGYSENFPIATVAPQVDSTVHQSLLGHLEAMACNKIHLIKDGVEDVVLVCMESILNHLEGMLANTANGNNSTVAALIDKLLQLLWSKVMDNVEKDEPLMKLFIMMDMGLTTLRGMLQDHVIRDGFDVINNIDFRDWLTKHGAQQITVQSCLPQSIYSLIFAGRNQFSTEAGTALRGCFLLGLAYKGSFYYRMQAGMGDTIFTPMYEVLRKRGVKFKFFHRVYNIGLSPDKNSVQNILVGRQATVKVGEYNPIINVKGLGCWPSYPLYDQLEEGAFLKENEIDLESPWADWTDPEMITLEKGKDFDVVIYGISLGSVPHLCKEILDVNQEWRDMVENIKVVPTQALQLWLKPDDAGLGWKYWEKEPALFGTYEEPYDTYADMSDLLKRESWDKKLPPEANDENENYWPNHIAYFCGPIMDLRMQPYFDHSFPRRVLEHAKSTQIDFLNNLVSLMWPNATDEEKKFKWELLVDHRNRQGEARLDSQYSRVNLSPSELYVLSVTNSSQYRLEPDNTGCDNMYITGDWIKTGINAGCVEASIIAGKKTARAISGLQFYIPWEKDILGDRKPVAQQYN